MHRVKTVRKGPAASSMTTLSLCLSVGWCTQTRQAVDCTFSFSAHTDKHPEAVPTSLLPAKQAL